MIIQEIKDRTKYDAFMEAHPYAHYLKSSMWGEHQKFVSHTTYQMLGFYEEGELKGSAMVLFGKMLGHRYLYIPKGPCIDYEDRHAVQEAFFLLEEYAKKNHVHFLRTDPNVLRKEKDIEGNVIENGMDHEYVTGILKQLGYRHKGYGYAYDGSWANRYTLIVNLEDEFDTVRSRFSKGRKTALNRHKINCVQTRKGSEKDLDLLMKLEKQLSEQKGFQPHSREFFENILECFGDHAAVYVTSVNLKGMKDGIEKELAGKKYAKDPEARASKMKTLEHLNEQIQEVGEQVEIACGIFVRVGTTSYDLYTYNHKSFLNLNPVDSMHLYAMQDMKSHGVKAYDLCGFSGVTDKSDPEYGLYDYKKSFGSVFIEQIGEFDYPVNENAWKRFVLEKKAEVRIRRAVWSKIYKKKSS